MPPVAIIQARMGSTRMPGKVLRLILDRPMLWHIVNRVRAVSEVADVVVATSDSPLDVPVERFCRENGIAVFTGSERDVLDRFYRTAVHFRADPIVRITGDCPFADPVLIGRVIECYGQGKYDHVGIATGAGAVFLEAGRFPDGLDAECFSFDALERAWQKASAPLDREHVTPYIWRDKVRFRCAMVTSDRDYSALRWTVDQESDFELVSTIYAALYTRERHFLMDDIIAFLTAHPEVADLNREFVGHEGYPAVWGQS